MTARSISAATPAFAFVPLLTLLTLLTATPALSAVLIEVDVSDPAAVTFTATSNPSQVNDSSTTVIAGVDLVSFLAGNETFAVMSMSGNLTPPSLHGLSYNSIWADGYSGGMADLNLTGSTGADDGPAFDDQTFSTAAPAFTGVGTMDLTAFAGFLPSAGTSGNIIAGYSGSGSHAVLGQWQAVVPEPSMLLFATAGAATFLCHRRTAID